MPARSALVCAVLLFQLSPPAAGQDALTPEKRADIERFLEVTDALAFGQQLSQAFTAQISNALATANPGAPPGLANAAREIVDAVISEELPGFTEQVILIYDRHFSHDEIRGFIEFYSTDLGRKAIRVLPQITQESMMAGQIWGQSLQPEIDRRLRAWLEQQGTER
jgi:uncharacterized protein